MPVLLHSADADFAARLEALVGVKREAAADVRDIVAGIVSDVRIRGDFALFEYTKRFDKFPVNADNLRVGAAEIAAAKKQCGAELLAALELAASRIDAFHRRSLPSDFRYVDEQGVTLGARWTPVDSVGIYVPGGLAAYPSSVLMNAVPARVAGVPRVAMAVPAPEGQINPAVLAAADIAGVSEIYRIGGAQAIAALAYGTASVTPVDKITGPGNAYVAEAKRQVFGAVGIDMIAGPSEILVIADAANDPGHIAADLLSQAEHDASSQSILLTPDDGFARKVVAAVEAQLETLPRRDIAGASWRDWGYRDRHARSGRSRANCQPFRARACGIMRRRSRRPAASYTSCGFGFSRAAHAGGYRRLHRRNQSYSADRTRGALFRRTEHDGLHEAHDDHRLHAGGSCRHRPRCRHAGECRRAAGSRGFDIPPP